MTMHYYNENDDYAATWIENLILDGHIPDGKVDRRSIVDVRAADLVGFTQCHFFAGIAGWPLALRLAGWPEDREIWTGSCPCQPFSSAGNGGGLLDERHLWPAFFRLIGERRPPVVVGEQVASKDAEPWLDVVLADLETLAYAGAAVAFPSAGVGAPHIRDRTYWMGYADSARLEGFGSGHQAARRHGQAALRSVAEAGELVRLADRNGDGRKAVSRSALQADAEHHVEPRRDLGGSGRPGPVNGFWRGADWLHGRDHKWRPVEPGTFPLADGVPDRVGALRAYGNAINAQQGAEFMRAVMECLP